MRTGSRVDRRALVAGQPEARFQSTVVRLARLRGWKTYHTHDSRRSAAGFPDLVLARPPRLVFAELKAEGGRVAKAQDDWLTTLAACDAAEAYVWRPGDWDEIDRTLR